MPAGACALALLGASGCGVARVAPQADAGPGLFPGEARAGHAAISLPQGTVLIVGGEGGEPMRRCELFDPASGRWAAARPTAFGRRHHTATLLPSGRVLVAGGDGESTLKEVELYDAVSGNWRPLAPMRTRRLLHTATLLQSGQVLAAGGWAWSFLVANRSLGDAELFEVATGSWRPTGSLKTARHLHSATLLPSGKVLVAGGRNCFGGYMTGDSLSSAELFDPATGTWSSAGAMAAERFFHTATLLASGQVLVTGGRSDGQEAELSTCELFDPASGRWSPTGTLAAPRAQHTSTLLPSGEVLVTGGMSGKERTGTAEIYDPSSGSWTSAGSFRPPRAQHTATLLPSGKVLLLGGQELTGVRPTRGATSFETGATPDQPNLYDVARRVWSTCRRAEPTARLCVEGEDVPVR